MTNINSVNKQIIECCLMWSSGDATVCKTDCI